jgi:hypothetical protein
MFRVAVLFVNEEEVRGTVFTSCIAWKHFLRYCTAELSSEIHGVRFGEGGSY